MKKTKLIGLSLLAFSAVGVMASCGGHGEPISKPDVYFRARASILDGDEFKKTEFKDEECAEVTIIDKDKLEYGKQDVVVNIKPKQFFSFRKYDASWAAISAPSHPYVGLGTPLALYSYPLQENVAWTFKDKSTPIEGHPGFYNQEYEITIKKEFFKKNIVIDYGNVDNYDNSVYVYSSDQYAKDFSNALVGDFSNIYNYSADKSLFAAGSNGATVTYTFRTDPTPFTFKGWDNKPDASSNANDGELYYKHFKVEGGVKDKDGKMKWTNIAYYKPNSDTQDFIPTVVDDKYLSFFINWNILAGGPEVGYNPKFEKIQVTLNEPSIASKSDVNITFDQGIEQYAGGFFQKPNPTTTIPLSTDGTVQTYNLNETTETLSLSNVLEDDPQKSSPIYYGVTFKMPEDKKYFAVEFDGREVFDVDLATGELHYTKWRGDAEKGDGGPGCETPYWSTTSWHLVLLNPSTDNKGSGPRLYGGIVEAGLKGKDNLYYLYANSLGDMGVSINVKIKEAPKLVNFEITDETTQGYGSLTPEGEFTVNKKCMGKSELDLEFYPASGYEKSNFIVTLKNSVSDTRTWSVTYVQSTGMAKYAIIRIKGNAFKEGDKFTISLALAPTKVTVQEGVSTLGCILDENGKEAPEGYQPAITEGQTDLTFTFKFNEAYRSKAIIWDGADGYKISPDVQLYVLCNNQAFLPTSEPTVGGDNHDLVIMETKFKSLNTAGDLFKVVVNYMSIELKDGTETIHEYSLYPEMPVYECVGQRMDNLCIRVIYKTEYIDRVEIESIEVNSKVMPLSPKQAYRCEKFKDGTGFDLFIYFDYSEFNYIQTGTILSIIPNLQVK